MKTKVGCSDVAAAALNSYLSENMHDVLVITRKNLMRRPWCVCFQFFDHVWCDDKL